MPAFAIVEGGGRATRIVEIADGATAIEGRVISPSAIVHGARFDVGYQRITILVGERRRVLDEHRHLSTATDGLTGLCNRRTLYRYLERSTSWTIVLADIDRIKWINDIHGMMGGDTVIKTTATRLRAEVRWPALLARVGGEEFIAAFPGDRRDEAIASAERMRVACEALVDFEANRFEATISIGIGATLREAEDRCDAAKRAGRNRIVTA